MNFHRKPPGERPSKADWFKGCMIGCAVAVVAGQAYADINEHATQSYDHTQTQQQLAQVKEAPTELSQIEDSVICPVITAVNSFHSTEERVLLIKIYCSHPKAKGK